MPLTGRGSHTMPILDAALATPSPSAAWNGMTRTGRPNNSSGAHGTSGRAGGSATTSGQARTDGAEAPRFVVGIDLGTTHTVVAYAPFDATRSR